MKLRADDLKTLYQRSLGTKPDGKAACPSEDVILKSFTPEMSEEEKFRIVDHVAGCGACRSKFEAAREILKGAKALAAELEGQSFSESEAAALRQRALEKIQELEGRSEREKKRSFAESLRIVFFRYRYASVTAGMIMVFLAVWLAVQSPWKKEGAVIRGEGEAAVTLEAPQGIQEKKPSVFQWRPYPGAREYEVRVLDEELDVVWSSGKIKTNSIEFPASLSEAMKREAIYYWKISVYLEGGEVKESHLQEFRLKT